MDKSNSKELIVVGRPKKEVDPKILGNLSTISSLVNS